MKNISTFTLAFALTAAPCAFAQNAYISAASGDSAYTQADPAPIERAGVSQDGTAQAQYGSAQYGPAQGAPQEQGPRPPDVMATHPAHGVTVRADSATEVKTVAADAQHTELRLERGIANVIVRNPAPDMLVLVDLPGGQVQLLKDGFYTFNAGDNTARVFSGEADAFAANRDKPVHVKGGDQVVFTGGSARVSYSDPYNARADVLAAPMMPGGGYGGQGYGDQGYAEQGYAPAYNGFYGGYGDGFYGDYPYYAYGYPYGYYGWGYPGFGLGLGFGYGWGGGYWGGYGYRGGYGGYGYGGHFPGGGGYPHPGGGYGGGAFHGGSVGGGGGFHGGGGGHR